jgi:glutamyl-tRNA synthetase/glutamyl-Q tRNA(Asp) synthetase
MLDDLDWLGFVPDDPDTAAFRERRCAGRQSDRGELYDAALGLLQSRGLVYACECSRRTIAGAGAAPLDGEETRYPGTCVSKGLSDLPGYGLRVRLPAAVETFDDVRHGRIVQRPWEQCGDLLVRDRAGNWTYQFAVTVDDWKQGVSFVIRGDDLLASTGRQIQLSRFLGRESPPRFLHHALIMKAPAQKLSKSDGDSGVADLRARGWTAPDVIGHAAWLGGLIASARPYDAREVQRIAALEEIAASIVDGRPDRSVLRR